MANQWKFKSTNVGGNLHEATDFINKILLPEAEKLGQELDVVAMESSGYNSIIVYKVRNV